MQIENLKNNNFKINAVDINSVDLVDYTVFLNAQVLLNGDFELCNLLFEDKKLIAINEVDESFLNVQKSFQIVDLENNFLTPALVEQHIHGAFGINFNTATKEELLFFLKEIKKYGVSYILATIMTDEMSIIRKQIQLVKEVMKSTPKGFAKFAGVHLEGPFINREKKGIHNEKQILIPSIENYKQIEDEIIKLVTYAPEKEESLEFSNYLKSKNVIKSVGHSTADYTTYNEAGAKQITHIFNAINGIHHRNESLTCEALINDEITIEIIGDTKHISAQMLKLVFKVKNKNSIILISDALPLAHSKDEEAVFAGEKIYKTPFLAKNKEGQIAGSVLLLSDIAKLLKEKTNLSFKDFISFASTNPAKNLGLESGHKIQVNNEFNFVVWDSENLTPKKTFLV